LRDVVRDIQSASEEFSAHWEAQRTPQDHDHAPTDGKRADRAPRPSPSQRFERGWTRRLVLATVLIVVAVGTLFLLPLDSGTALSTVEVISGEQRTIDFADGSTVRLVGPAEMAYQPASQDQDFNRQVTLESGRGFFEVEKASTSFVVETPTARTTVIGTTFGVTANASETEVVLASGAVALESRQQSGDAVTLAPGQASNVRRDAPPTPPSAVDVSEKLAWSGLFVFRDTPVRQIAERLSTRYGVPIEVHPELRDDVVTGTFERSRSVEDILGVIASTLGARVNRVEGTSIYRLAPASTP
jgi:ferric-dicitrate binding protein FerR (iron transport regulator)